MNKKDLEAMLARDIHSLVPGFNNRIIAAPAAAAPEAEARDSGSGSGSGRIHGFSRLRNSATAIIGLCAAVLIFCAGMLAYFTPVSYVGVDINPSIVMSVNMFDRVVDINPNNEDGESILKNLSLNSLNVSDALNRIVAEASIEGYVDKNSIDDIITVSVYDNNEKRRNRLESAINSGYSLNGRFLCRLIILKVRNEQYEAAKKHGISPGKMLLIDRILKDNSSYAFDQLKDKSIGQLIRILRRGNMKTDDGIDLKQRFRWRFRIFRNSPARKL